VDPISELLTVLIKIKESPCDMLCGTEQSACVQSCSVACRDPSEDETAALHCLALRVRRDPGRSGIVIPTNVGYE